LRASFLQRAQWWKGRRWRLPPLGHLQWYGILVVRIHISAIVSWQIVHIPHVIGNNRRRRSRQ
jgi:hypothetical protein